jgi:hypothetical protein
MESSNPASPTLSPNGSYVRATTEDEFLNMKPEFVSGSAALRKQLTPVFSTGSFSTLQNPAPQPHISSSGLAHHHGIMTSLGNKPTQFVNPLGLTLHHSPSMQDFSAGSATPPLGGFNHRQHDEKKDHQLTVSTVPNTSPISNPPSGDSASIRDAHDILQHRRKQSMGGRPNLSPLETYHTVPPELIGSPSKPNFMPPPYSYHEHKKAHYSPHPNNFSPRSLLNTRLWKRLFRLLFYAYVVGNVVFTTMHLIASFTGYGRHTLAQSGLEASEPLKSKVDKWDDEKPVGVGSQTTGGDLVGRVPSSAGMFDYANKDFMLSKLFQHAMKPFRIEAYHLKALADIEPEDITITTILDPSRYDRLVKLVHAYRGPISVTVHINDNDRDAVSDAIRKLDALVQQYPLVGRYVDAHLLIDKFDRQFNLWRNIARFFARSQYVVQLDVDFYVCTDFRATIRRNPELMRKLKEDNAVLVIPAFEYSDEYAPKMMADGFPTTKMELLKLVDGGKMITFHAEWARGHGPSDYNKWYASQEAYPVVDYNFNYEPYVIMRRDDPPWCDERFVGYGSNKAACLYEIYLGGYEFWVLPQDFLVHQWHEYPSEERAQERRFNRRLYEVYREEACFRYNRMLAGASANPDELRDRLDCIQFSKNKLTHGLIQWSEKTPEELSRLDSVSGGSVTTAHGKRPNLAHLIGTNTDDQDVDDDGPQVINY